MKEIDNILDNTRSQIKEVEAPEYLLTRAKQQFENLKEVATPRFIWSSVAVTLVLLVFNVYVIGQQKKSATTITSDVEQYANSLNLNSSNQLYTNE